MPEFHLPSYKIREEQAKDFGLLQKRLIGYTDGSRTWSRTGAKV